jgi:uncharacterized protein YodC (DUF2158 family)
MDRFDIGDLVVLTAGSMRMAVERVEDDRVHCVWVHEGRVGRDSFPSVLLKKWEFRDAEPRQREEEARTGEMAERRGPRQTVAKPFGGPASPGAQKRPKQTGWDGKPRDRKFFRKD